VLDQELSRLPNKYRVAIVLCDLEGKSHKAAARQLGWPQGTLSGRLVRARKMLAGRLARYGQAVSSGALAAVLSQNAASACVPTSWVSSTVKAASLLAAGQLAVTGLISVKAAALTEGVVTTMLLNKVKTVTMMLVIAAMAGGAGLFYRTQAAEPAKEVSGTNGLLKAAEEQPAERDTEPEAWEQGGMNLLPTSPMPRQALVSLAKGQLVVRTLDVMYEPTTVQFQGKTQTSYQKAETLRTRHYDTEMVKVYDVRGKKVNKKGLPELLARETIALVSTDVQAADPLNLRLFKEGTLLFVLPAPHDAPNTYYAPGSLPPAVGSASNVPPFAVPAQQTLPSSGQVKKP
jgi:hypothetical protein